MQLISQQAWIEGENYLCSKSLIHLLGISLYSQGNGDKTDWSRVYTIQRFKIAPTRL